MSGVLLVLLGIWGGLIPLVGPYVHYAYTPNHTWTITSGRIWLEFVPAAGTLLGGLILLASRLRPIALLGGSLAVVSGAWFAVGGALAPLWTHNLHAQGFPIGGHIAKAMEQVGFFPGLGVAIVLIASIALGRLSLVSVRDATVAEPGVATVRDTDETAPLSGAGVGSDTTATSRWPSPLTNPMRRVAASKGPDQADDATATTAGKSASSEPISSGSSKS
jgi:fermentation-respiration switch protein FrsA (DUF1100 family)